MASRLGQRVQQLLAGGLALFTVLSFLPAMWAPPPAGAASFQLTPVRTTGLAGVTSVSGGTDGGFAVQNDGSLWAWGRNQAGQLGDGTTTTRFFPVKIASLTGVASVAGGFNFTIARTGDGAVWAWGDNTYGQLGDGTTTASLTPKQAPGLSNIVAVSAGLYGATALAGNGAVWTWGDIYDKSPTQVFGPGAVVAIAAGGVHNLALKSDGTVWVWGRAQTSGLLGTPGFVQFMPAQVPGLSGVTAVAAGALHSMVLKSDGSVWTWGGNFWGQLGNNTTTDSTTPMQVLGLNGAGFLTGAVAVAGSGVSPTSWARTSDGDLLSWGENTYGQLGDGTQTHRSTPGQVLGVGGVGFFTGVTQVAPGGSHTQALRSDQTVWGWGRDVEGQLGDDPALPSTSVTLTPPANPAGWNKTPVAVTLTCTPANIPCGLTEYNLNSAGWTAYSGPVSLNAEGAHVLQYRSRDQEGNQETARFSAISIDLTPPTLTPTRNPAPNANGWNAASVTVTPNGSDSPSGIASCTPATVSAEGASQSATVSCVDRAGNIASQTVGGINIDKTAPVVTVGATVNGGPYVPGTWTHGPVVVTFNCAESGSGVAGGCPAPQTLAADGDNQSVGSGPVCDLAGNCAASVGLSGIRISSQVIAYALVNPPPTPDGWNNSPVTVKGIAENATGSVSCTSVTLSSENPGQSVTVTCTDAAGTTGSATATVKIDLTPPQITGVTLNQQPNAAGWNNAAVTLTATGGDSLSGLASCDGVTVLQDGANQTVAVTCRDKAGNVATQNRTVKLDTTPPTQSLPVNLTAYSFDLGGVTVDYSGVSATDALGGPVTPVCAPASGSIFLVGLTTVQCSATDAAGNTTQGSFFVTVISYDVNSVQASITQSASQLILPGQTATVSTAIADQARLQQQTELRDAVINQVLTVAASVNATQLAAQASLITIASTQVQLDQANSTAAAICSSPAVQAGCTQRATVEMSQIATTLQTMLASQTAVKETLEDTHAALQAKVAVLQEQADDLTEELEETQQRISHPRYLEVEAKPARGQESFSVPITLSVGTYSDAPVRPFGALLGKQHFDVQVKAGDEVGDRRIEVEVRVGRDNRPHLTVRVYKEGPDGGWKKLVDNSAPVVSYDPVTGKLTTKFSMAVKELHGTVFVIGDDETAPALNGMPADITIEATGPNGEIATWTAPTAIDDVDGAVPVSCLPASGGIFPLGTTTVTCSAADEVANSAGATFKVTVRDTTPPTLTLPANIASNVAAVSFTATAADLVSGSVPVTCTPASGSAFPQETTTVACSAADARGNTASGSFIVTVTAPPNTAPLKDFVAYSQQHTWILKGTTVQSGGVGANGERTTPPAARKDKKEEVRIGERVQFQSSASKIVGDTVWLQKLAKVFSIFFNELRNNGATIQGTQTSPLTTPVLALPTVPTVTPGTQDITVKKNQTVTLAAGAYRTITVEKGGTLKLTGGLYQVQSVDIRGDADVLFRAASELRVKNELDTDQKTYFGPDPAVPGLRAKDIKVIATGGDDRGRRHDDDDNDPELGPTVVQFGHHNTVKVNVYAPNGTVWVKHDSDATGAFIGQKVRIGHDATLALDSGFGN